MAQVYERPRRSLADALQSLPKPVLYGILILFTAVPLFLKVKLPNRPEPFNVAFYDQLMKIPDGGRVLIASDWTNSTRGESMGGFEVLLKILMRKNIKFAVYSTGAAEAPQVARDVIRDVSQREAQTGGRAYVPFEDYVVLGYFPNSEGTTNAINNNIRAAFAGKKDFPPNSPARDVLASPVFRGVNSVADFNYLIVATASKTNEITVERVKKTPLMFVVTGVMVPENITYFSSGQIKGLVGGVKGVYDIENLMDQEPTFKGKDNLGKGTAYYLSLHFAIILLIIAVIVGNVAMFLSRRGTR